MLKKEKLESILAREDLKGLLLNSSKEAIGKAFGERVEMMVGYDQNNPHHQYDLFEHTIEVMENLPKDKYSHDDYMMLKVAGLFHDIGKPDVAKEKGGKTTFINHATKSKEIAGEILREMGYTDVDIQRILFFVQHHDDFINISSIDNKTVEKVSKTLEKMKDGEYQPTAKDEIMLLDFCKADASAQKEIIEENGEIKDTRKRKIERYEAIEKLLPEARTFKQIQEQEVLIAKAKKELEKYTVAPTPIVKKVKGKEIIANQKLLDMWNEFNNKPEAEKNTIISEIKSRIQVANRKIEEIRSSQEQYK